jgi:hypothetical protein
MFPYNIRRVFILKSLENSRKIAFRIHAGTIKTASITITMPIKLLSLPKKKLI